MDAARERGRGEGRGEGHGRAWLVLGLCGNLLVLAWFKYADFGVANLDRLAALLGRPPLAWTRIVLPAGLSFYVLQSVSYLIDVWRGTIEPSRNLLNYAAYKAMFSQLIAGPIVRYAQIAAELRGRAHTLVLFGLGARRFMIGFCMKVIVADTLAPLVDAVFALDQPRLAEAWLGALAYTLQLYFDFAGYSAMAIGLALMIGFHFPENFRNPYLARCCAWPFPWAASCWAWCCCTAAPPCRSCISSSDARGPAPLRSASGRRTRRPGRGAGRAHPGDRDDRGAGAGAGRRGGRTGSGARAGQAGRGRHAARAAGRAAGRRGERGDGARPARRRVVAGAGRRLALGAVPFRRPAGEPRLRQLAVPDRGAAPLGGRDAALQSRAEAAGRVAAALAARHVGLLVALVPDKARVEQASLCGVRVSAQSQARYGRFLAALRAQGVQVADLWAADRRAGNLPGLYYRTDTHWSQRGAALAADAVAASVATGVPAGTPTIIPTGTPAGGGAFTTRAGPVAERAGDLLRLMSLDHVPNLLRPHPDREAPEHTVAEAAAGAGLLDDGAAPSVVLLGTSFSLNGNFAGRLEQALGREVAQFATEGGGFDGAAARFFAGPFWRDTPPRLVVWEMPERVADQPPGAAELDFWQGRSGGSIAGPR